MIKAFFPERPSASRPEYMGISLLIWPGIFLLAIFISRQTDIDWLISSRFFDVSGGGFLLRDDPVWKGFLHDGLKRVSVILWLVLLGLAIKARLQGNRARYEPLVFVLVTSALAVCLNSLLRSFSLHSCPWNLREFGGQADYFRLLMTTPANPGPGQCLPSGHASVAFMWLPAVYASFRWRPQWSWWMALAVLVFGVLCGLAQIVRGAHFLTHILVSAAVCGGVSSVAYYLPDIRRWSINAIGGVQVSEVKS